VENETEFMQVEVIDPKQQGAVMESQMRVLSSIARANPRSIALFRQEALSLVTADTETAESCFYSLKRTSADGTSKLIIGPSVRLAEIAQSCYQHLWVDTGIISEGQDTLVARATAIDVQRNICISKQVVRRISGKNGRRYSADMIAVTANAAQSIAARNVIQAVIPRTYINQLLDAARKVAVGDVKTLAERRQRMMEWASKSGIPTYRIFAALGVRGVEDIGLAQLEIATGLKTAINEGEMTIDEAFPEPVAEEKTGEATTPASGQTTNPTPPANKESKPRRGRPPKIATPPQTVGQTTPPAQPPQASPLPQSQPQGQPPVQPTPPTRKSGKGLIQEVEDTGKELLLRLYDNSEYMLAPEQFDALGKYTDREVSLLFETRGKRNVLVQYRITPEEGDAKPAATPNPSTEKSAFFDSPSQG